VFGDDLVDAAGEWKLVPNRLVHQRAETIVVGCARPNDCCWHFCMDRPCVAGRSLRNLCRVHVFATRERKCMRDHAAELLAMAPDLILVKIATGRA
jgi:hypothetical protein